MDGKVQPHGDEPLSAPPASAAGRRFVLPNQMEIAYQSRAEVEFFYHDIFEKQIYLKHGVTLHDGDCIFDIGANIGLFTLFAHQQCRDIEIYAFEPAPPLFEILRHNLARYGVNAKLFNCGLANEEKTAAFTFYPNSSGMSSFYADRREEQAALRAIMVNQLRQGMAGMEQVMRYADDLLDERLRSETYNCRLRTVSDIIRAEQVARIDLMKVDVQKSELDIVAGIQAEDWPKIRQIVIEVHDLDGRLRQMTDLLEARGYQVAIEQDDHYQQSILYNLFARRTAPPGGPQPGDAPPLTTAALAEIRQRARRQEEALHRRKQLLEQRKNSK
jgi:FkbM family methyltransferase